MSGQLPDSASLCYDDCLIQPTQIWGLTCDISRLYEFGDISQLSCASISLKASDEQGTKLLGIVWIAKFLNVSNDTLTALILQYCDSKSIRIKRQVQRNRQSENTQRQNIDNGAASYIPQIETSKGTECHLIVKRSNVPKIEMDIEQGHMDSNRFSAVTYEVIANQFSAQVDAFVDMLLVLANLGCEKFHVPDKYRLNILTYTFTTTHRNLYWQTCRNANRFLGQKR